MNNRERGERVRRQIELRLDVLRDWSCNGVPPGQEVPPSLNRVRIWEDAELGISRIGSPTSFTTKHPVHGASVKEIDEVLAVLINRQIELKPNSPLLLFSSRTSANDLQL